jgi:alkanesulfonate monooxygenase SsuD/methylene tetrahydromethanopterin reductase-like flavin-dependent oxidoreductase (luciferase family)
MEVGLYIRDYMEDPYRPMYEQVEEAAEVCRRAKSLGFSVIYMPQHYISHPTVWMQPMQTLARLAPDAEEMKLLTGILLLPYHNPVDIAEQTVTLDHISNGRFILGVGLGYRVAELSAFGTNRRDRVSRFEESIELMKLLWTGDEVNFDGRHWQVHDAKLALTPVQEPHPPIWIAAQSRGAVRRAAVLADRVILGPQPGWKDISVLTRQYKEALEELGKDSAGRIGVHRSIAIARDRETAITEAREMAAKKAGMYTSFNMQENTTVDLGLGGQRNLTDWAIAGSPQDCADIINRCKEEEGLDYIGLASLNLPKEFPAKLEYLQLISEELLPHIQ